MTRQAPDTEWNSRQQSDANLNPAEADARVPTPEITQPMVMLDAGHLEAVFDAIDLAVAAFDREWCYIYLNDAAARVLGRARDEALGRTLWDDSESMDTDYAETLRHAMRDRTPVVAERFFAPAGAWYEVRGFPLVSGGLVLTYRDITLRKAWEAERERMLIETRTAQVAAEARANELDAVFDALADGAAIYDAEGHIVRVNRTLREVMGIASSTELAGEDAATRMRRFVPRDENGQPMSPERFPVTRLMRGEVLDERHPGEMYARRVDGRERLLSVTGNPLRDDHGNIVGAVAIVSDITEQRRLLRDLAESETRYRATFEQAAIGLARVGLDGQWIEVNQELCGIVGYPRDEVLALTFQDITYPPDLDSDLALLEQLVRGEIPRYSLEKRYVRKDSSLVWILLTVALVRDDAGQPRYFISAVQDIDEIKRLEAERVALLRAESEALEAAQTSEARLNTLVATLPQLILVLTPDSQRITFANARWAEYTGIAPAVAISAQVLPQLLHPHDAPSFIAARQRAFVEGHPVTMEARYRRADGKYRWFIAHLRPIRDTSGEITGWFFSATDIDDLKQTQERLEALTQTLEERVAQRTTALAEANRDLDAFARTAAHDLRAPLRGMEGFAEALIEDYGPDLDPLARQYVERIARAARTMDQLIRDLLAYAQLGRTDITLGPVSLAQALRRAQEQVADDAARRGARITVEEALPQVCANVILLTSVLSNLLANALVYVAPGVTPDVRVTAERYVEDGQARVRVWICDNGIGIAPEHQQRIFDPFERLHGAETYPGTGIGLATVRRGMERMGGRAGVESALGVGSRFWIELPAADSPTPEPRPITEVDDAR